MTDSKTAEDIEKERKRLAKQRQVFLDDMFNDIYSNKKRIFSLNFTRGLFFGAGTFIGGTVGIALLIWVLSSFFSDWTVIQKLIDALQR